MKLAADSALRMFERHQAALECAEEEEDAQAAKARPALLQGMHAILGPV